MYKRTITTFLLLAVSVSTLASTGCFMAAGPNLGLLSIPIPVTPYMQKIREDKYDIHERYAKVPILDPLTPGAPSSATDVPSDHEVMAALERARPIQGGIPGLHEIQRNNVRIVKEKIADYVDQPRVMPLVGPVQLHHAHYKCTVYFTERKSIGWPIPHTINDEDEVEVIYIDHNHLHRVGPVDTIKK